MLNGERAECPYTEEEVSKDDFAILPPIEEDSDKDFLLVKPDKTVFAEHRTKELVATDS